MNETRLERVKAQQKRIKEKSRRGLRKSIFGRTGLILMLLLLQVALIFFLFFRWQYSIVAYTGSFLLSVIMSVILLNRPMDAHARQTWLILVLLVPGFGALLYAYIEMDVGHHLVRDRLREIEDNTAHLNGHDEDLRRKLHREEPELDGLADYLGGRIGFPVCANSEVKYFRTAQEKLEALLKDLEAAEHFIFLEYFIIDRGEMWSAVLDVLARKAAQGVDVRVLYDGTCAVFRLPYSYPEELKAMGIRCKMFSPLRPVISTYYNNRDHRKIVVTDGKAAYTGGINLADEYMNLKQPFGEWKDAACRVTGDAVRSFTLMFLRMWNITDAETQYEPYLNAPYQPPANPQGYVIPFADSPFEDERVSEAVILEIVNRARRYVHIMTPYLILDETMSRALQYAAKRGVDVKLILPHHPDKKSAFSLAYTHYNELIEAGVQIFEFAPGFVHAKVFISDDIKAMIGSVNLDYRSLYLHFEDAVLMWKTPEVAAVEKDFHATLMRCRNITAETISDVPLYRKVLGPMLKMFSPLM